MTRKMTDEQIVNEAYESACRSIGYKANPGQVEDYPIGTTLRGVRQRNAKAQIENDKCSAEFDRRAMMDSVDVNLNAWDSTSEKRKDNLGVLIAFIFALIFVGGIVLSGCAF